ncbi:MAG: hypothetical protein KKF65_04360 [Nanoarchaeota archaeon]|nr:hypothetical protein [Nanoarchaeota archaeon]
MKKLFIILLLTIAACSKIPSEQGDIKIYFCPEDNCEKVLLEEINHSKEIKCAFYDLNLENLTNALKEQEILVFEDNYEGFGTKVYSKGLMHNKFCIFDNKKIFTGSFNPTYNGNFKNNNNLVLIESETLSKNYLDEFEEIKQRDNKKTKNTQVKFNNFIIENYFCPEDNCKKEVLDELMDAKESIYFMTFSFTDSDIADVLIEKSKTIIVAGIMEKQRINMEYNVFHKLNNSKVKVIPDSNPRVMHHKVFIIDRKTVVTGSYNPTKNGNEKNDENMLIIHNEEVSKKFLDEVNKIANY